MMRTICPAPEKSMTTRWLGSETSSLDLAAQVHEGDVEIEDVERLSVEHQHTTERVNGATVLLPTDKMRSRASVRGVTRCCPLPSTGHP